jgi:hypothetical protein
VISVERVKGREWRGGGESGWKKEVTKGERKRRKGERKEGKERKEREV